MSMMIGVAFSLGAVSTRITPSSGSALPRWAVMSSSAGSDIRTVLLWNGLLLHGCVAEKVCEWRDFVCGALDADHRRPVDLKRGMERVRQLFERGDIHRVQSGKHGGEPRTQAARAKPVVAVDVVVEQLLSGHAHRMRVVVEKQEGHWQAILQRGVDLHPVHEERAVARDDHGPPATPKRHTDA